MATTKAFGYLRVSGKGQVAGDGFPRQRAAIERYAKAHGLKIVRWFEERGVSGTLEHRPAWDEMFEELAADGVQTVVIEKLDRLARDLMIQEQYIATITKHGWTLISTAEPDLCSDEPTRVMMRQILGSVAQYDKSMIVAKLRGARERQRAKTGRCEGRKPYGFREGEQAVIERMDELAKQGLNYTHIAERLNDEGFHTRSGKHWFPATVRRILAANA